MKTEIQILQKVNIYIKKYLSIELKQQGHYLTGGLERSIQGEIKNIVNGSSLEGSMANYGFIVDAGTAPSKIPYSENSGATTSKYISGLTNYFKLRGLSEKEAKRAAFATAKVQKKEGMPTRNSYSYAKNNERREFIEHTNKQIENKVDTMVFNSIDSEFEKVFNKQLSEII